MLKNYDYKNFCDDRGVKIARLLSVPKIQDSNPEYIRFLIIISRKAMTNYREYLCQDSYRGICINIHQKKIAIFIREGPT